MLGIVEGGATNAKSTCNGVFFAAQNMDGDDILLVHDVTDPIINEVSINKVIERAIMVGCAGVVTEQVHTLYKIDENGCVAGTIEKKSVASGYSPEAFRLSIILESFLEASEDELCTMTSALALVHSKGKKIEAVFSHQNDLKITYKEDMNALLLMIENGEKLYKE